MSLGLSGLMSGTARMRSSHSISAMVCSVSIRLSIARRLSECWRDEFRMSELSEIEAMLRGSGDLRQRIVRNLGSLTVSLFAVFDFHGTDLLQFVGKRTLDAVVR